jgi:hypothetical protein
MNTRKTAIPTLVLWALVSGGFSSSALASDVNYRFVEGSYLLDAELENADGDGLRVAGSFRINNEIYAFGEYDTVDLDDISVDVDVFKLGVGYIYPLDATWDANFSLAYADVDTSLPAYNDGSGYELSGGVRAMIQPHIEVRAQMNYMDIDDSDTYFTIGGSYFFQPNLAASIDLDLGADYETLAIGVRYLY